MNFAGKVVLVTGASSGIGAKAAQKFAQLGASLSLTGRKLENLEKVANECEGQKPLLIQGDITNPEDTKRILEETIKKFGKLDVLVNNAGIIETGTIENTSLEQYDRVMNTNIKSIYHLTMLAVPHLIKTEGSIVNVSSVNGIRWGQLYIYQLSRINKPQKKSSFPGVLAYNLSKAAVDQFTRCVALELASKKVRVNSVNPGTYRKLFMKQK